MFSDKRLTFLKAFVAGSSPISISPDEGNVSPHISLFNVVFPAPFLPITPSIELWLIVKLIELSTVLFL